MMSAQMQLVWDQIVVPYSEKLCADDPRFLRVVHLIHEDGTVYFFHHAFLMQSDNYIVVFTEHNGDHIHHRDDLHFYKQFDSVNTEIEKLEEN